MKRERRAWLTRNTLRYLAGHMDAIVGVDCGLWDEAENTEEGELVRAIVARESRKIWARAKRKP